MTDPATYAWLAAAALAGLVTVTIAALKGWRDWIALQRFSIEGRRAGGAPDRGPTAARIELADLRERVRKLEAIAAGVEL